MKYLLTAVTVLASLYESYSQPELKKIAPLSPDAAAIAKYGEIPVGTFTGVPQIGVPLYTIAGKEIQLPLSLSYHAGGNKVEDVASWVGLGWSLGSLPCISRSARGLEDDAGGGYFNLYNGKTVQQIYDERGGGAGAATYNAFIEDVRAGTADAEPDIYSFSLLGKSGKFYYRQADQKFYTIPLFNIKIERITNGFRITDEDGTVYDFNMPEVAMQNLNQVTGSWWATKIVNANRTDSITIEYTSQPEVFTTTAQVQKNIYISGASCSFPSYTSSTVTTSSTSIKPDRINFKGGYVKFFPQGSNRQDLTGGKALDRIEIYNYLNQLIKKWKFQYVYHNSGCSNTPDCYRLVLDRVWEEAADGQQGSPHIFTYNTTISVPHRQSTGQDYWGYNNGQSQNADLIPDVIYETTGTPRKLVGANRDVNIDHIQFLMLNKITWPTGGSTEFEYESNWVDEPTLPIKTKDTSILLAGNGTASNTYALYEKTFVVDVPAHQYLNGNEGGVFVNITIGNLGCDLSGGANVCANLTITGVGHSFNSGSIISNVPNMYLPNGTYKMQAEFSQDPPQYGNFTFAIAWKKPDSQYVHQRLAGGVRLKKLTAYDGISHSNDVIKKLVYTKSATDSTPSGKVFGLPYLDYGEYFSFKRYDPVPPFGACASCEVQLFKRSTSSNITMVSHSGSFVGYERVVVESGNNAASGKTEYIFSNEKDIVSTTFPYPPAVSNEHKRGLLLKNTNYRKTGTEFHPVSRVATSYSDHRSDLSSLAFGLKIAAKDEVVNTCGTIVTLPTLQVASYDIISNKMLDTATHNYVFNAEDSTKVMLQTTSTVYNSKYFPYKITTTGSALETQETFTHYPGDLSLSGAAETARQVMISQNRLAVPLQVIKKENTVQKELLQTNYKEFTTGKVFENNIEYAKAANTKEVRVQFNSFDNTGNLLEQQKTGDVQEVYLWGYNGMYPVAKLLNTTYSTASTYITQSVLDNPTSDAALRTHLNNLRSIPGAMVVTYTYKPLVGLTSETDPSGRTTFYEYDGFGRLSIVRDQHNNILKKICYNYAGQTEACNTFYNVVKSGNFTRNNCATGYQGTTVTYTVSAGTYSASSQTAADALAQNDVDVNGQAYANQTGICQQIYYSIDYSGYYYSEDCSSGQTPDPIYVSVPAGSYTSVISQLDANNQAYQYAQNYANQNGTCSTPSVDLFYSNNAGEIVYVVLTDVSTSEQYFFQMSSSGTGLLGSVPAGNYDVEMTTSGFNSYGFEAGCSNYYFGTTANFFNITINGTCNNFSAN